LAPQGRSEGPSTQDFPCGDFAPDQSVQIQRGLETVDVRQNLSDVPGHLLANLLVIAFGELSALVLEIQILNVSEQDFLLAQEEIPFRFFNDGGFQGVFFPEQRNADRSENAACQQGTKQVVINLPESA
jgi:hypothetical protein